MHLLICDPLFPDFYWGRHASRRPLIKISQCNCGPQTQQKLGALFLTLEKGGMLVCLKGKVDFLGLEPAAEGNRESGEQAA